MLRNSRQRWEGAKIILHVLHPSEKRPSIYWMRCMCVTCALQYCWIQPAETKRAPGPKLRTVRSTAKVIATTRMRMCKFSCFLKWNLKHKHAFLRENIRNYYYKKNIIHRSFVIFDLFAIACHKGSSTGGPSSGLSHTRKPHSRTCHVPWRAAARAGREKWGHFVKQVNNQFIKPHYLSHRWAHSSVTNTDRTTWWGLMDGFSVCFEACVTSIWWRKDLHNVSRPGECLLVAVWGIQIFRSVSNCCHCLSTVDFK